VKPAAHPLFVTRPLYERFWEKVQKSDGCWEWTSRRQPHPGYDYGVFTIANKQKRAHRVSWELTYGQVPAGLHVLHKCDNASCVRPDHLFLGTSKDNMQDASRKGRTATGDAHVSRKYPERLARGERSGNAKLTTAIVVDIRRALRAGKSVNTLACLFGVHYETIRDIKCGRTWKHLVTVP